MLIHVLIGFQSTYTLEYKQCDVYEVGAVKETNAVRRCRFIRRRADDVRWCYLGMLAVVRELMGEVETMAGLKVIAGGGLCVGLSWEEGV